MESTLSAKDKKKFQRKILDWYAKNKRDLPWRQTRDPYKILVSEMMLQQTQVERVIPKYHLWFKRFPAIDDLAGASVREVLALWSGLGYNRRALFLQKCASEISNTYRGKFPDDERTLLALPGIGKYTARALLCFAWNKQVAVIDTNVKKVILTQILKKQEASIEEIEKIATDLLPKDKAYEWNQAVMDYASLVLKKEIIVIKKQSKFKNSNRYFRGQVIKILLKEKTMTQEGLVIRFASQNDIIEGERLEKILMLLEADMLISRKGNLFFLPQ